MTIDQRRVNEIFLDCLFKDGEDTNNYVKVEGLTSMFGLHPDRMKPHIDEVKAMLAQFPSEFFAGGGDGYTFLNLCQTADGIQWTGSQSTMQELVVVAIGMNLAEYVLPRDYWSALPGGVPYVVFDLEGIKR